MTESLIRQAKIFLVDDQEDGVVLLEQMLRKAGYSNLFSTTDSRQALSLYQQISPDLLILDLHMPPPDGYEVLDQLAIRPVKETYSPILVLTADITPIAKLKALSMGARDFLTKPVEQVDLLLRVRNLLETRMAYRELEQERLLRSAERAVHSSFQPEGEVLARLGLILECCDTELSERAGRVSRTAALIAEAAGLSSESAARIEQASRVYDLGMLAVPDEVRHKSAPLSREERQLLRNHTWAAEKILKGSDGALTMVRDIAVGHHERWDGGGYPNGLRGEAIPVPARIVAVAEAFDLLTHDTAEKPGMSAQDAIAEILRQSGFAFDPEMAVALAHALAPAAVQPA